MSKMVLVRNEIKEWRDKKDKEMKEKDPKEKKEKKGCMLILLNNFATACSIQFIRMIFDALRKNKKNSHH